MSKQWYAVHTYAGQEEKIKQNIERRVTSRGLVTRIGQVLVPTEEEERVRGGKRVKVKKKIFPGYVLVEMEMDDETWHFISETVGVTGFLGQVAGSSSRPTPLQPEEVERLIGIAGEKPTSTRHKLYHKGDRVSVVAGPFAGNEGQIDEVNAKAGKLTVLIIIFNRETPVDLEFAQVERIS